MIQNLNFVFFGTPDIAVRTLEILKQNDLIPSLIVTAPDKPQGRKLVLTPPPVKIWAEKKGIPVLQPEKLDSDFGFRLSAKASAEARISDLQKDPWDLFVVIAYGKIFPKWLINLPKHGTLNIHYSLLPKYRGAAPVQVAILAGDTETGVTVQKMVKELDAGPIVAQETVAIGENEKTPELLERLVGVGVELLVKTLPEYLKGSITPVAQDHSQATKAPKIKKEDGLINLGDNPELNWRKFRAYHPWPGVYFFTKKNVKKIRIKITNAELKNGELVIIKVLPEGKKEMSYKDFLRGYSE